MLTLPTTIGSIVTFETWADTAETEKFTTVATLMVGAIEGDQAHGVVWADAYIEDIDQAFAVERILANNPKVIFEAAPNPGFASLGTGPQRNVGETVTYTEPSIEAPLRLTATFTPGFIGEDGDFEDCYWMSSYGQYVSDETLEASDPIVVVRGAADL